MPYVPDDPIVIVDDEDSVRKSYIEILSKNGFDHFVSCGDSRECMRMIDEKRASVVVLDLMMPHVRGEDPALDSRGAS